LVQGPWVGLENVRLGFEVSIFRFLLRLRSSPNKSIDILKLSQGIFLAFFDLRVKNVVFVKSTWKVLKLGLGVSSVETNQDREFFNCREVLVEIVKTETLSRDYVINWDFRASRLLRLGFWNCQEILDCQDLLFKLSRISRLSRCPWCNCPDRDAWSRPCRDKLRPQGLIKIVSNNILNITSWATWLCSGF